MENEKVYQMSYAKIYPLLVGKAEKKFPISSYVFLEASADFPARSRTSSATTEKPFPADGRECGGSPQPDPPGRRGSVCMQS